MTLDVNRVVATAIETAFENGHGNRRRHRLAGVGAVATGIALATVARAATQKKVPRIARLGVQKLVDAPRFRDLSDRARDRLADAGFIHEDEPAERDRYQDEEWDDSEDYDEGEAEPEAEADEDWDDDDEDDRPRGDEDDDEPRDEDDGNHDGEPNEEWEEEADEREDEPESPRLEHARGNGAGTESGDLAAARRGPPDLMQMLSGHRSPPPALARARRQEPLRRPPAPAPRDRADQESQSKSNSKSTAPARRRRTAGRN